MSESDPRVFFAAERTLLAWLRTGLTVMALGFVVARFGLFLRIVALQVHGTPGQEHFAVSGVLPASYSRMFAVLLSALVGLLGLLLAAYLVVSHA